MKKLTVLLAALFMLTACGSSEEAKTGFAETAKDAKGDYASAKITVKGDAVESITLDETKDGKSKKELGANYNMKPHSKIKKEWNKQVEFLEKYIVKNGIDKVELTDQGYPKNDDVLAGCTINITNLMQAAKDSEAAAKK